MVDTFSLENLARKDKDKKNEEEEDSAEKQQEGRPRPEEPRRQQKIKGKGRREEYARRLGVFEKMRVKSFSVPECLDKHVCS